jgi:hypothetical protein
VARLVNVAFVKIGSGVGRNLSVSLRHVMHGFVDGNFIAEGGVVIPGAVNSTYLKTERVILRRTSNVKFHEHATESYTMPG